MKDVVEIKSLFRESEKYADQEIVVEGWVRTNRGSNKFGFIELNDGTFFKSVQVVYEAEFLDNFEEISKAPVAAALCVTGTFVLTPDAKQPFEIKAKNIVIEAGSEADYPLQKKRHSMEFLREIAHLRPRSNTFSAVFRVRSIVAYAIHKFFQENNFVYAHTPIITASDCEGAGEMFQITTLDLDNPPRTEDGEIDYSQDFFGKKASLTVSGQLEAEIFALAFKNVYTFGPTFRAENSNTARHASEFWMIEPEMAFADLTDDMDVAEAMIKYIINYVLEMARIESGKLVLKKEVGCVTDLIESLIDVFEPGVKKKFITYSCETDIQHKYVIGDEIKVREIFINIIGNSVKYTPEGGKISVSVKEESFEKENYIAYRIIVEDNGIGMSKEYLPHIFEEFSREHTSTESKVTGTGLGLPIVKSLIDMMGGTIEVESQLGCGTKMTVVLPFELASEKQILEEKQKEKEKISDSILGKRVLLAEDNELNAEIAMTILKENGLKAERAVNGKQCMEMLKKMPEDYYDMILMDIQMPEMDGYEATKLIRNLDDARADIPIVAMTANAFEEDRQKALESGMNAHVSKPVDMNMLFKVMTQILKK